MICFSRLGKRVTKMCFSEGGILWRFVIKICLIKRSTEVIRTQWQNVLQDPRTTIDFKSLSPTDTEGTVCPRLIFIYRNDWFWELSPTDSVKAQSVQVQYLYTEMIDFESLSLTDRVTAQSVETQYFYTEMIDLRASHQPTVWRHSLSRLNIFIQKW